MKFLALLLATLLVSVRAVAQIGAPPPPPHVPSLDLLASNSASIVTGTISSIDTSTDDWQYQHISVKVKESLKGDRDETVTITVPYNRAEVKLWKQNGALLLFAGPTQDKSNPDWVLELSGPGVGAYTSDLTLIRNPDPVLRELRKRIRENKDPAKKEVWSIPIPMSRAPDTAWGKRYASFASYGRRWKVFYVDVPIDEHLEEAARHLLRSRDADDRFAGVQALAKFKSDGNIELLKGMLKDPGYNVVQDPSDYKGIEGRDFFVRRAAFEVLKTQWKVQVEAPSFREDVSRLAELELLRIYNPMSDADFTALQSAKRLRTLDVYGEVTPLRAKLIGRVVGLTSLRIYGGNVFIDDARVKLMGGLKNLRSLDLSGNPITDEGLKTIAGFPKLRDVNLFQTRVSMAGLIALRDAHPNLHITPDVTVVARQTNVACDRVVYRLTPKETTHWSTQDIGLSGPLQWDRSPTGRDYFGPFGQQAVKLDLSSLPRHKNVRVEIELWVIGSWDGDGSLGAGPDIIDIQVPGVGTMLHSTFFNNTEGSAAGLDLQSFPDPFPYGRHLGYTGAAEAKTLGFTDVWDGITNHRDAVYKLHYTFAHNGKDLVVVITGMNRTQGGETSLLQDEHWGIGNVVVKTD